ncbi:LAMI_0E02256g1_1 [Lachancea mirantina]|uniref:LAMI_0E02256g1_1 n=1 Tax=Lachancea mirantina TaxID=1230905 RepID=A0A1G4JJ18_9SACH|nr:LAMI_0E02256g1_1 [Lachancea mirantina]
MDVEVANKELIKQLVERDRVEQNFSALFQSPVVEINSSLETASPLNETIKRLKRELKSKTDEVVKAREILLIKNRDSERLRDEIISLDIENNVLREQLEKVTSEYDALVTRWLEKAQQEADNLNEGLS